MPKLDREMLGGPATATRRALMSSCSTATPSASTLTALENGLRTPRSAPSHEDFHGRGEEEGLDRHSMKNDWKTIFPEGDR